MSTAPHPDGLRVGIGGNHMTRDADRRRRIDIPANCAAARVV
jgi:hypothetical protein